MKWIGQHIWKFASRFRNDVYLESLSSSSETDTLVVDSNGKITKNTSLGGDITGVTAGTNLSGGGTTGTVTLNVDDAFLVNNADDTTTGTITAGGFTTTGTWTFDEYTSGTIGITTVQDSGTTFNDNDTSLMTAAAIADKIEAYGYSTTTGDITGVTAGTNLTGGGASGSVTLNLADASTSAKGAASFSSNNFAVSSGDVTIKSGGVDLTDEVTGTLPVANGGTGATSLTDNAVLTGTGTSAITAESGLTYDGNDLTAASSSDGKPILTLKTTHTTKTSSGELQFLKDAADTEDGEVLGQITFYGEDEGNNNTQFASIVASISESDETDEAGTLELKVAESDGTNTAVTTGLKLEGEHATDGQIDVTIANGAASTTTIKGDLSITTGLILDSVDITNIQTAAEIAEEFTDNDTSLMTSAAIQDHIQSFLVDEDAMGSDLATKAPSQQSTKAFVEGKKVHDFAAPTAALAMNSQKITGLDTPTNAADAATKAYADGRSTRVYGGTTIKLLPSDFVTNEEGGATKHGIGYMDHAGTSYGMKPTAANTDLVAFMDIPEGKKVTHIAIYDKNGVAWEVFEVQINATTMTSKGTGTCNAGNEAVTNTNATATNFLAIVVSTTATGDRVYGGLVTIADQ